MKRFVLVACVALLVPMAANAELQLWISYHFQGVEAYESGKYRDAQALLTKAHTETCDDYRLAFTMDAAGLNHMALTEYADAEKCFNAALCLRDDKSCCGGELSRFVPATLNNLADLHYIAGNKDKVECLYRRALDLNKRDSYSIEVGRSLNGLALVAADADNVAEAENLLKRAVRVHFMGSRSEHPYMATVLTNLGILYTEQGKLAEAEESLAKAKRIQDTVLGEHHPDVAVRLAAEANLLTNQGNAEAARVAQSKSDTIRENFAALNAKKG